MAFLKLFAACLISLLFLMFSVAAYSDFEDEDNSYPSYSSYPSYDDNFSSDSYYSAPPSYSSSYESFPSYKWSDDDDSGSYRYERRSEHRHSYARGNSGSYAARLPQQIATREKVIVIDPRVHAWGAYDSRGNLIRGGIATAGSHWCEDIGRPCRTRVGSFRIASLGNSDCYSKIYPVGEGGAPMPYCMFFNGGQGIHGSYEVADANLSHGCVRVTVDDAEWIRYNFANVGTKVIVKSY